MTTRPSPPPQWSRRRAEKQRRLDQVQNLADGVVLPSERIVEALEALIAPGDRVVLEGNNQKQADFLSRSLAKADPGRLHDLHMIMPSVSRAEHLDLYERGIARKLDFSFAGPQSLRIGHLLEDGLLEVGAIHTYIELYSRLLVDLIPNVALVAGFMADRDGNIYSGPSTEDTPALVEPTAFIAFVGWVERSDTHRWRGGYRMHPSYRCAAVRRRRPLVNKQITHKQMNSYSLTGI